MAAGYEIGDRVSYDGALCTVHFIGEVGGTTGTWLGVEWDDPSRGKHDGCHRGVRYFSCRSKSPIAASFVRPTRRADPRQDFVSALHEKYASEVTRDLAPIASANQIEISGKVVEEVGFDKIRRKLAQLHELRIVILDGMRIAFAETVAAPGSGSPIAPSGAEAGGSIREVCPRVVELDLSRNLFTRFGTVVDICSSLDELKSLRVNGNRFQHIIEDGRLVDVQQVFENVRELALEETLMTWGEIYHIASKFPQLNTIFAGTNQLSALTPPIPATSSLTSTLTSINLEYNDFTSISDLAALTTLSSLRNLHLKGNNISGHVPPASQHPAPVFPPSLHYLDISYNQITSWSFIDALPSSFPGVTSLRFAHNPIYDNPDSDNPTTPVASTTSTTTRAAGDKPPPTEESYMITLARLPGLQTLNFSAVTPTDRTNADLYYLARATRELAAVPAGSAAEQAVLARHPAWRRLCDAYGEPAVVRKGGEVDGNFLEGRLVRVALHLAGSGDGDGLGQRREEASGATNLAAAVKTVEIPKSFDIYTVKGLVARMFGLSPLKLRLVWETGEWDPVAGFDEEEAAESSSSGDEDRRGVGRHGGQSGLPPLSTDGGDDSPPAARVGGGGRKAGRWVKREMELKDGPRQFGYCVDGLEARIRVEVRRELV